MFSSPYCKIEDSNDVLCIPGTVLNNFLNENGLEIFEEIRPQIAIQVGEMVQLLTNKALGALSPDHFADVPIQPL